MSSCPQRMTQARSGGNGDDDDGDDDVGVVGGNWSLPGEALAAAAERESVLAAVVAF